MSIQPTVVQVCDEEEISELGEGISDLDEEISNLDEEILDLDNFCSKMNNRVCKQIKVITATDAKEASDIELGRSTCYYTSNTTFKFDP